MSYAALLVLLPVVLVLYAHPVFTSRLPSSPRGRKICLLIAHPDDEAMFFAPTLLALTAPERENHVKILCLSSGNADGLGEVRKKELVKSAMMLGLRSEEDVFVVDDSTRFPDSMTTSWSTSSISSLLSEAFVESSSYSSSSSRSSKPVDTRLPPNVEIDILITFDPSGVSSHVNHRSLYHGACAWLTSLLYRTPPGNASPVALYTLTSVNVVRKYSSFLDVLSTLLDFAVSIVLSCPNAGNNLANPSAGGEGEHGTRMEPRLLDNMYSPKLVFASGPGPNGWGRAWRAMTTAHVSQMLWFRYGWILLSRYMVVNDLRLVTASEAAAAAAGGVRGINGVLEEDVAKEL